MNKESSIERAVVRWATKHGISSIKMESSSQVGLPDRLFLITGGKPLFIEFKAPTGKLSMIQTVTIKRLTDLKYNVHVVTSKEVAIQLIKEAIGESNED